jgi:hypothetical protein
MEEGYAQKEDEHVLVVHEDHGLDKEEYDHLGDENVLIHLENIVCRLKKMVLRRTACSRVKR